MGHRMTTETSVEVRTFTDWDGYLGHVRAMPKDAYIFRGQRDPGWKLQSPWDRNIAWMKDCLPQGASIETLFYRNTYKGNTDAFVASFKNNIRKLPDSERFEPYTDNAFWALGRHYELISPLLDWTRSPFIGAFFSLIDLAKWLCGEDLSGEERLRREKSNPRVAVWALRVTEPVFQKGSFELVDEYPSAANERQKAQEGVFTRLRDGRHFDVESYLADSGKTGSLYRMEIPREAAGKALRDLHDRRIHYASLYPDLDGAVRYANTLRFVHPEAWGSLVFGNE